MRGQGLGIKGLGFRVWVFSFAYRIGPTRINPLALVGLAQVEHPRKKALGSRSVSRHGPDDQCARVPAHVGQCQF